MKPLASVANVTLCSATVILLLCVGWLATHPTYVEPRQVLAVPERPLPAAPLSIDGDPVLGERTAAVAMVLFSDFQCPFCGTFARETLPTLRKDYVDPGRLTIAFKHLPLTSLHPLAMTAAAAAECAGREGRFWDVHDRFFARQQDLSEELIGLLVADAGMTSRAFTECERGTGRTKVAEDAALAYRLGITSTPTVLIGPLSTDGTVKVERRLAGSRSSQELAEALRDLVRQ